MDIRLKRIYEPRTDDDGLRILVDGLWPRGVSRQRAGLDEWLKELAPSASLRRWFNHDPDRWGTFRNRYKRQLTMPQRSAALARLRSLPEQQRVTLLYAAADEVHNHARVVKEHLESPRDIRRVGLFRSRRPSFC